MDNRTTPLRPKQTAIDELAIEIKFCTKCEMFPDNMFCNIIASKSKTGIGFWSDAYPNYDAKLIIIGQDWGSEASVNTKAPKYEPYYQEPKFFSFKNLMKFLKEAKFNTSGGEYAFTDIYLTNAVLCARKGNKDSGPIPDKYFIKCYPFLEKQIDIIKPKIIATLGKQVFEIFSQAYKIKYQDFYEVVGTEIKGALADGIILFPLCHTSPLGLGNREKAKKAGRINSDITDDFIKLKEAMSNA